MNKEIFIEKLHKILKEMEYSTSAIDEVIDDYKTLIDEAIQRGENEVEFIEKLGAPQEIAKILMADMPKRTKVDNRIIAISPFVAAVLFFYLGFNHQAWNPGWLVFLLIPITAISIETKGFEKYIALSVFVSLTAFMLLGTYLNLWHPMWALFLIIPGLGFLNSKKTLSRLFGVYTLVAMVIFILIVLIYNPAGYLHFLLLIPIPVMGIISGEIELVINSRKPFKTLLLSLASSLLLLLIYLWIGLQYQIWHPTWLMFLIIPIVTLLYRQFVKKEKIAVVSYTPFISVIIFFLLGEYAGAYHYSWLVFFLIPVTAILFEKRK